MNDNDGAVVAEVTSIEDLRSFFTNRPVQRDVKWGEDTRSFFFRRITGAERLTINRGQKVSFGSTGDGRRGGKGTSNSNMEMDLGDLELKRAQMVYFAVAKPNGDKLFKNLDAVKELPEAAIAALDKVATEVNEEGVDPGKS